MGDNVYPFIDYTKTTYLGKEQIYTRGLISEKMTSGLGAIDRYFKNT